MVTPEPLLLLRDDAADWCEERSCVWRVPLLLFLAYLGFRYATNPMYGSLFSGLTLGLHEMGHVIFRPAGEWVMYAGGSLTQLAAPVIAALVLLRHRDYFGVAVAGCWLSFSLYELATYIGDAQAMALPLVSVGGGDTEHDWHYLLTACNLLEFDARLATMARCLALLLWLGSLALGAWLCWLMARRARPTR